MASYSVGAAAAGVSQADGESVFKGRVSFELLVSAIAIAWAVFLRQSSVLYALMMWSFSQGLMNAVTTCFPGTAIRTTHVTGSLTDLGLGLGRWFRARKEGVSRTARPSLRLPLFLALQVLSFGHGGFLAHQMHGAVGVEAAFVPALVLAILSLGRPSRFSAAGVADTRFSMAGVKKWRAFVQKEHNEEKENKKKAMKAKAKKELAEKVEEKLTAEVKKPTAE